MSKFTVEITNHGSTNVRNLLLRVDLPLNTSVVKSSEMPLLKPRTPLLTPVPYGDELYWIAAAVDANQLVDFNFLT